VQLYARTRPAEEGLVRAFEAGAIVRRYLALVVGFVPESGEVRFGLTFNRKAERIEATPFRGKDAITRYEVVQRVAGHTLLACWPQPDWPQQVRAHLLSLGFPIVADPVYGHPAGLLLSQFKPNYRESQRRPERPLMARLALHAAEVALAHPVTGAALKLEAPPPKDLRATLKQLERLG
jgi:23S rRNA pseudouridine1911/1915/1917 synthase